MNPEEDEGSARPQKRRRLSSDQNGASTETAKRAYDAHYTSTQKAEDEQQAKDWDLGIRSYVDSNPVPLCGSLKTRYTDFLVNEILLDGTVLHLKGTKYQRQKGNGSREVPVQAEPDTEAKAPLFEHVQHQQNSNGDTQPTETEIKAISSVEREQLVEYLNETAASQVIELYQSIQAHPNRKSRDHPTVRTDFTSDRSLRGKIHQFIRETFHSKIDSSTDHDGILVLTAATAKSRRDHHNGGEKQQRFGKLGWAERGGEYVHFTLYKENKDTMEAISYLARQLKCNAKVFQFAGTKDRRAVTTQRCSAHRIEAERLAAQNGSFRNSKVGDFEYHPHSLELGDLKGNEFVVTLRDASMSAAGDRRVDLRDLNERMGSLHKNGYINYYGHQRFGTFSMRTDAIGGHILRENFKAACDAILHFSESILSPSQSNNPSNEEKGSSRVNQDDLSRARAISQWRSTNSAQKTLDLLPRKFSAEAQLIRHLSRNPNDYFGALMLIQRNLRLMYVHAYQSYVWNFAASNRIELYGSQVVPGDLVLVNEHKDKELHNGQSTTQPPNVESLASVSAVTATDADGDPILEPSGTDRAKNADDAFERARALTAADIAAHKYTIFDLVLPQPGFDILYPDNESGIFYETFMKSDSGGNLDPYNMRRRQRDFSLAGAYRKLVGRIGEGWSVQVHEYERDEEQFVQTDWEALMEQRDNEEESLGVRSHRREEKESGGGVDAVMMDKSVGNETEIADGQKQQGEGEEGEMKANRKTAVVLKFQLGSSQYATIALRELSKGGIRAYKPEFSSGR